MNDLPGLNDVAGPSGPVDRLNARLDSAERRLLVLEQRIALLERAEKAAEAQSSASPAAASAAAESPLLPEVPQWQAGGIFPVLGRAMLGIAGAYLLRALAQAHVLPPVVLQFSAIIYALLWLAAGARARAAFAATVYACTSVLILAPMLWELTLLFKAMPAVADAFTLAVFVVMAFAMSRGPERAPVLRVANVSAAALCLALAVATHLNLPFLAALLLTAAICEFAAAQETVARSFVALAADLGVWMLIYIYRAPENARMDYPALSAGWLIAPGALLFVIFVVGLVLKTAGLRQRISIFDMLQVMVAFFLAASGLMYFGPSAKQVIFGLLCLALAAVLYASIVTWLRTPEPRNRIILGVWSAALLLAGIWLCAPAAARPACLAAAAVAALAAGAWLRNAVFGWHSTVFLLASAWTSGLLSYILHALAGTPPGAPSLSICVTATCAAFCYALLSARPETLRAGRPYAFLFASIAAMAAAALLAQGSANLAAGAFEVGPHHRALIRSFILCVAALALAFSGARWRRPELTHIGYAVVALEAIKLVVEDLRHGHLAYVAASVCLFALTLITIPRVAQRSRERKGGAIQLVQRDSGRATHDQRQV